MPENFDIKEKFIKQLKLYIAELDKYCLDIVDAKPLDTKMFLMLIHKIAGLCLTFGYTETGEIARYVEVRLKQNFTDNNSLNKISISLLDNLLKAAKESLSAAKLEYLNKNIKNEDMDMLKKGLHGGNTADKGIHILIADDDPVIRMLAERKLKLNGYKVTAVKDGVLAVKIAKSMKPDLILMDGSMPNLDGIEASEEIRKCPETASIPIFLLTAYDMSDLASANQADIIDEYIEKPFKIENVIALINKHFSIS